MHIDKIVSVCLLPIINSLTLLYEQKQLQQTAKSHRFSPNLAFNSWRVGRFARHRPAWHGASCAGTKSDSELIEYHSLL